jgi:predicted transcriptional regulator of viral defense system
MLYLRLIQRLQREKFFIFSLQELLILFPEENKKTLQNQLTEWVKRKYVMRLKKNLYELTDKGSQEVIIPDLYVANKLYLPSYISLETALSVYNIIPEVAFGVTSVTTNVTRVFKNNHGRFSYFSCQPKAYIGYRVREYSGFKVFIAEEEKAVVDFLYFRFRDKLPPDFKEERLDKEILKGLNWKKLFNFCEFYNHRVRKMAEELARYIRC